jgi:hypothetical protein
MILKDVGNGGQMTIKRYAGENYFFEVENSLITEGVAFSITAIDRFSGKCSQVNNLNAILSQFDFEEDDPRMEESDWVLSADEYEDFQATAEEIFRSKYTLEYIESNLDDDRREGEWANARKVW